MGHVPCKAVHHTEQRGFMNRDNDRPRDRQTPDPDDVETTTDSDDAPRAVPPNPPRTTAGGWTAPKFGSAGSGGAELEPGPERD
jgi:hypothetical protein